MQDRVCYMILCDNLSDKVVQINKTLIDENHAKIDSNWQGLAIKLVSIKIYLFFIYI